MLWMGLPRFYCDLETTSKYSDQAWTLQLGTGLEQNGELRVGARWLNPGVSVPEDVIQAIRLKQWELERIAAAPSFATVAHQVERALYLQPIFCGYNIISYDAEVLRREFGRLGLVFPVRAYLDVMIFARHLVPADKVSTHQLEIVAHHLGVKVKGHAHRADADCAMTSGILAHLIETGHLPIHLEQLLELQAWLAGFGSFFQYRPDRSIWINCNSKQRPDTPYKGKPLAEVYAQDPGFIKWAISKLPRSHQDIIREAAGLRRKR